MNSNLKERLLMLVALLIALILGIVIGRATGDPKEDALDEVAAGSEEARSLVDPLRMGTGSGVDMVVSGLTVRELRRAGERGVLTDPVAAVFKAKTIPRMDRYAYLDAVFASWGAADGSAAAAWVSENMEGVTKSEALTSLAGAWADSEPFEAAEWFKSHSGGETQEEALSDILNSWSRKAPEDALAWAENLDPDVKSWVMGGLAEGWASVDPAAAAVAGLRFVETDFGHDFLVSVATQWAASGPREVAEWASTIEDNRLKASIFLDLGNEWGISDPNAALAWIEGISEQSLRERAETGLVSGWAENDPGAALDWAISGKGNPKQTQRLVKEIVVGWSESDPGGAANYMNTLPQSGESDAILAIFSSSIAELDPYSAIEWASTISNQANRSQQMQKLAQDWVDLEGSAAREALRGMKDLPPELHKLVDPRSE